MPIQRRGGRAGRKYGRAHFWRLTRQKKNPTRRQNGPSAEWQFSAGKKFSSVAKRDPDIPRPIPKNSAPPIFWAEKTARFGKQGNSSDTSSYAFRKSKGNIACIFFVCIRTGNPNQTSFFPFGPHEKSVLFEHIFGPPQTPRDKKAGSTQRSSHPVPHGSTDRALRRLTSEFERDPVYSSRYGRRRISCLAVDENDFFSANLEKKSSFRILKFLLEIPILERRSYKTCSLKQSNTGI